MFLAPRRVFLLAIPGVPVAKARARVVRAGRITYTPRQTREAQHGIGWRAKEAWGQQEPLEGPLRVEMTFYLPVPASWAKKRQAEALAGQRRPTGKPDVKNLLALVEDGLNRIVWEDDGQNVELSGVKWYSAEPRTEVRVWLI